MPHEDPYNEVIILSVTGIIVFLVLTGLVVFILLFYQKKKFRHKEQLAGMEKTYSQELLKSQLEIQEQTFNSISQEIHDNVGQVLSLAKIQLNTLGKSGSDNGIMIAEIKSNISKAMGDLRDIAHSLNTDRLKFVSLYGTVKGELQRIGRSGIVETALRMDGIEKELDEQRKLIVFRIIQESLQNTIKHANATFIDIVFIFYPLYLTIEIMDNGIGFDTEKAKGLESTGLGLRNIVGRAAMIGGSAEITSATGNGTTIKITIPIHD